MLPVVELGERLVGGLTRDALARAPQRALLLGEAAPTPKPCACQGCWRGPTLLAGRIGLA